MDHLWHWTDMMLPQLQADKANHAITGAIIFIAVFWLARMAAPEHAMLIAAAAVLVAAVGKEISDWVINRRAAARGKPPPHGVELLDAAATCFGGVLAALPLWISMP
jgi:hypothetical protein